MYIAIFRSSEGHILFLRTIIRLIIKELIKVHIIINKLSFIPVYKPKSTGSPAPLPAKYIHTYIHIHTRVFM